ncbi:hypothetical protein [Geminicoccus roseus]|uniref:hypothetical protein n=1 Tax=Geminicoccus roseus TaxID=404900 RepID=UPI0003FDB810|nr:hypothetical protein [Geminicoccus roseus]
MRDVGITILPEFFQNEGVEAVLDNVVARAGATAIATSPYVMEPSPEGQGSREPPADAGAGKVRLLDRPLWGRRELWVRTAPSYAPDDRLYAGLRYQPAAPTALTEREGGVVAAAIRAARQRGLQTQLQVQAAIPPGYRVQFGGPVEEDRPALPDGQSPGGRVDNNGSLASPHVLAYTQALLRDLARAYPEVDAIRIDWPEYPPYSFDSVFFDFSGHAATAMTAMGFDVERMRRDVAALRIRLARHAAEGRLGGGDAWSLLVRDMADLPGSLDWLNAKARIVTQFIASCQEALREESGGRIALMPQAFPHPFALLSGFDYAAVARLGVPAIGSKLYTMHWPMMVRVHGEEIAALAQDADRNRLGADIGSFFDLSERPGDYGALDGVNYPEPDERHPAGAKSQARKIRTAQAQAGDVPVYAFAHGYGPLDDMRERCAIAFEAARGRIWMNRYAYLSDAKLDAIGSVTGAGR